MPTENWATPLQAPTQRHQLRDDDPRRLERKPTVYRNESKVHECLCFKTRMNDCTRQAPRVQLRKIWHTLIETAYFQ